MDANLMQMALQLSMQDMFSGSWFSNALMNKVWTEMMRSSVNGIIRTTGGPDLLGAALGGRLRGDAAMLRQASSNVSEAQSMMNMAADAVGNIASQLKEAHKLAGEFLDATDGMHPGDTDYQALYEVFESLYEAIGNNINSMIKNTKYNGIALLDGSAWNNDTRLSIIPNADDEPAAASVHIQAGDSGFPLTFSNMDLNFANITTEHPLYDNPQVLTDLNSLQSSAQTLANLYAGRAGSLQSQGTSLQSQAKILDEAVTQRAKTPVPVSPEYLLLNLILRDSGSLVSRKG